MRRWVGILALASVTTGCQADESASRDSPPIIDMHLLAHTLGDYGGGLPNCTNDQEIQYPSADPREPLAFARAARLPSPPRQPTNYS